MRHIIIALAAFTTLSAAQANTIATVEADNGQRFSIIETGHLNMGGGYATIVPTGPHGDYIPGSAITIQFGCDGTMYERNSGESYIPPRSVAAKIAEIACRGAKR